MTLIVAVKIKDGIILCGDKRLTAGSNYPHNNFTKISKQKYGNTMIGSSGAFDPLIDILELEYLIKPIDILKNTKITLQYIKNTIGGVLRDITKENNLLEYSKDGDGTQPRGENDYIFVAQGKIYTINSVFCPYESEQFAAIGIAKQKALGYLQSNFDGTESFTDANEKLKKLFIYAADTTLGVNDIIDVCYIKYSEWGEIKNGN